MVDIISYFNLEYVTTIPLNFNLLLVELLDSVIVNTCLSTSDAGLNI